MLNVSKSHIPSLKNILLWGGILLALCIIIGQVIYNKHLSGQVSKLQSELSYQQEELTDALSQRCAASSVKESSTTHQFTIESSGGARSYAVHTPAQYAYNTRTPAVIIFSGKGGTGAEFQYTTDFKNQPVLSIYPEPLKDKDGVTAWQGAPYSPEGVSDVYFVGDVIKQVSKDYCIDPARIYTVGMSNGGGIAWLSACYLSDTIAATASISGAYYQKYQHCPEPKRPVPVLAVHSRTDTQVPYAGSTKRGLIPIDTWVAERAKANQCQPTSAVKGAAEFTITTWQKCKENATVELLTLTNKQHGWMDLPDLSSDPNIHEGNLTNYIWEFLRALVLY